jgi:DNA polymerase III delta prime subunit
MFKSDRGGVDELLTFITEQHRVPIICICNLGNVKKDTIKQLQKECLEVSFQLPDEAQMRKVLERVISGEGMQVTPEAETRIIECAQQDFRRLVGILEFLHAGAHGLPITEELFHKYYGILAQKEKDLHITDSIRRLLNERLSHDAIACIYNADKSKAPMVVHQNYLKALNLQRASPAQRLDGAIRCMSSLVTSDVIEKIMYNTQCWYLQPVQGYSSTLVPSYYINRYSKTTKASSTWASVLSISSQSQNLKKNMHEILYNVNSRYTYSIMDIQNLIEVIYHNLMHGHLEEAARLLVAYDICDLGELTDKKAINVLDKISKFIKLSRYYKDWQIFKERMKTNKEFDTNLKAFVKTMQGPGMKITTRKGRPPKITASSSQMAAASRPVLTPVVAKDVHISKTRDEQLQLTKKRVTVIVKKR